LSLNSSEAWSSLFFNSFLTSSKPSFIFSGFDPLSGANKIPIPAQLLLQSKSQKCISCWIRHDS
jgi:hypothetical protein